MRNRIVLISSALLAITLGFLVSVAPDLIVAICDAC